MQAKNNSFDVEVTDRKSFIRFLELLKDDYVKDPSLWETNSLQDFLEAMAAYAEDIQGYYDNKQMNLSADEARWETFANILRGATMYE